MENLLSITFRGNDYNLDTTLRTVYKFQGMNNHTPYMKLIQNFGEQTIENQIGLLYCSFVTANPEMKAFVSPTAFLEELLATANAKYVLSRALKVVTIILGNDTEEETSSVDVSKEKIVSEEFEAMPTSLD